ncbi:MAG TPA: trigger factor [Melioribacteraceae bacterium]|nr:trigger factor [Melioribacteraceae bacterium]
METTINKINECNYELVISVPYSEFANDFEEAYKKESKELTYPGFRKGKAPISLIKRMYKKEIEEYAAKNVSDRFIDSALKDGGYKLLNKQILKDLKVNFDENVQYFVDIELVPELELKDYKGLEIEKKNYIIEPSYIDLIIKDFKKPFAELVASEKAEDKDYVLTYEISDSDIETSHSNDILNNLADSAFPNQDLEPNNIDLNSAKLLKKYSDAFVNRTIGDIVELTDEHVHGEGEHAHTHSYNVNVKIINVFKVNYKDLTEEQIKEITKNKCSTENELRDLIETDYKNYYSNISETDANNNLYKAIINNNPFEVPQRFVFDSLNMLVQQERKNLTKEQNKAINDDFLYNYLYPKAVESVQWHIISKNIQRIENIGFSEEEFENFLKERHEKTGIDIEKLRSYYKESKRHENEVEQKVLQFVKENNNFKTVDVPLKGE